MTDQPISEKTLEKTRATITFTDGTVTVMESDFENTNHGRDYSPSTWGHFPTFSAKVEKAVKEAQELWGKPTATIRYERVTKTIQEIVRTTKKQQFYLERTVKPT